ncbi:hypothetical protein SKAU_G00338220 [Synaphobranchus kaupii]|uniref:Uncharacterized protein n=1 Tax=Synaphobranchus kaupii TaxID=118154 RepID=A0A9Q1EMG1_SYNKA|nr:hypothetical protein SKAU_G00338220 [Synaphobranchus kaupii]
MEDWGSGNVTASLDETGKCICKVFLPDVSFPADRVELMHEISKELRLDVEIEINKHNFRILYLLQLVSHKSKLVVSLEKLSNLTLRVELLESGPDKYIKLEFELLRIELRAFEALVSQLKASLNSSSPLFESLYTERQRLEKTPKTQDGYGDLVRKETERAEKQISLAEEQIKLTLLQQRETKLRIRLLEERLRNDGIAVSDEDA